MHEIQHALLPVAPHATKSAFLRNVSSYTQTIGQTLQHKHHKSVNTLPLSQTRILCMRSATVRLKRRFPSLSVQPREVARLLHMRIQKRCQG